MKELLIALPVINELENLKILVPALLEYLGDRGGILCIDDNSSDGTDRYFAELGKKHKNINYIKNPHRIGLGNAYKMATKFALQNSYEWMQQMDSDFSHRLEDLKKFDGVKDRSDIIIGSRYIAGGGTSNWPLQRKALSYFGNLYAKTILGCKIHDLTGGFNRTRTKVLQAIDYEAVQSRGYSSQIELKYRVVKKGFRATEVPILFVERASGVSKMNKSIVLEAIWKVWWMLFKI